MWHHPDGKQMYGTAGHKVLPLTRTSLADISGENPDGVPIGGYWWLAHFSRFLHSQSIDIQRYCKALYRDTNP